MKSTRGQTSWKCSSELGLTLYTIDKTSMRTAGYPNQDPQLTRRRRYEGFKMTSSYLRQVHSPEEVPAKLEVTTSWLELEMRANYVITTLQVKFLKKTVTRVRYKVQHFYYSPPPTNNHLLIITILILILHGILFGFKSNALFCQFSLYFLV